MGAIVIDRRSRIHCCTATRPPGFVRWPVEPGRFLDGTETEFDEGYYAALAAERLAATKQSRLNTSTGSGRPVEVHFLPIALGKGEDTGFVLMIVGEPDEGLEHTVGNVVAEMGAVAVASQRGAARLDHLAFALCRRIDVLLALAHMRHQQDDGRLPLGQVIAAGIGRDVAFVGPADFRLLVEQAKAVALAASDWSDAGDPNDAVSITARTSDVLELIWTSPAAEDGIAGESELAARIVSRVDGWLSSERDGDALVRRLFIPIQ